MSVKFHGSTIAGNFSSVDSILNPNSSNAVANSAVASAINTVNSSINTVTSEIYKTDNNSTDRIRTIQYGGTGASTSAAAMNNLISNLASVTSESAFNAAQALIPFLDTSDSTVKNVLASLIGGGGAKIETGSYTGTGTYGASNPCSITFDNSPKFVIISGYQPGSSSSIFEGMALCVPVSNYYEGMYLYFNQSHGISTGYITSFNKIFSFWQPDSVYPAMNVNNSIYNYIGFI